MKHEDEYNALIGLAVGDDMDKEAFDVVSGLDDEQTTTPRCAFFEGEVIDGDKVIQHYNTQLSKPHFMIALKVLFVISRDLNANGSNAGSQR